MSTVQSNQLNEFSPATNGPSVLFSIPIPRGPRSGDPATPSSDDVRKTSKDNASSSGALSSPKPASSLPVLRYRRKVDPYQKDVSLAISEAIAAVATPAAERAEGRPLSAADYEEHGLREQRLSKSFPQSVEFFWRHKTIALLVVTETSDGKVLVEAESGDNFDEEEISDV